MNVPLASQQVFNENMKMKYNEEEVPDNLGGPGDMLPADVLKLVKELLEQLRRTDKDRQGSKIEFVYVASGGQHVETQYVETRANQKTLPSPPKPHPLTPSPARPNGTLSPERTGEGERPRGGKLPEILATPEAMALWRKDRSGEQSQAQTQSQEERIRQSIALLMEERYGEEQLFNLQGHWQAVYRILVDKGYCRDSDFNGFDAFIQRVMPAKVNKPYKKDSVKQISKTDFALPFDRWHYDPQTSTTRKPFDRMVAVATRFHEILEEIGA